MSALDFLAGGGEMGSRIREFPWMHHSLGPPKSWPQGLRTTLRVALTTQHPMFIFWGPEHLCFYNDAYSRSLGPEKHPAMLGAPAQPHWAEIWAIIGPQIEQVLHGAEATWHENQLVPIIRHGALQDVYWTYSFGPIDQPDAPCGVGGVLVVCTETTEQVLSEQRSAVERQRQTRLLQQMPGFVAVLQGPNHVFSYVNDAYRKIAGPRDFIDRTVKEVFPELEGQGFHELLDRVYQTGEPFTALALPIRLQGDPEDRFIDLLYEPIRDEQGTVVGIFVGGYDITRLVRSEAQLRTFNETLEQQVEKRTREKMQLEEQLRQSQKMEAVGQLTGGLAHDFNNLLAGISGSLELVEARLREGRLGGIERFISSAQASARRAAALTQRLLAFSRRQTLDPRPTDINRLSTGMEELIRRTVGPAVVVEVVGAGGLWLTQVDQPQLENALLNLCINARDAMAPAGGRLTVETANKWLDDRAAADRELPAGQYISLCVTDTGTGMTPEIIARAFDPFFTTKPLGEGTGLGLSMVYGFARQSGGQVRLYSEIGKGTTACLYLPRYMGANEASELSTAQHVHLAGDGETVLVIDDEPTIRMLVVEVLEAAGYIVLQAQDGPSGLKILLSDRRVDLLITDVGLPGGMNGRQVADAARASVPDLRVLFITGYAENAVVGNGHLGAGYHILTKPFAMEALASRVTQILEKPASPQ
jgi:signal transduction histidine kinase/ActR/RegA family two-component response regulator